MPAPSLSFTRRRVVAGMAAASALRAFPARAARGDVGSEAIQPFRVDVAEEAVTDLRRRLAATRWPERETVTDQSQGVQLARLEDLVHYWGTDYEWRKVEARLNALPMFVTEIDDLDIHFIHVRSPHANAMPMIMTHGWPGSILEFMKVIGPLTDPMAHGGAAEEAFHLVTLLMATTSSERASM